MFQNMLTRTLPDVLGCYITLEHSTVYRHPRGGEDRNTIKYSITKLFLKKKQLLTIILYRKHNIINVTGKSGRVS